MDFQLKMKINKNIYSNNHFVPFRILHPRLDSSIASLTAQKETEHKNNPIDRREINGTPNLVDLNKIFNIIH